MGTGTVGKQSRSWQKVNISGLIYACAHFDLGLKQKMMTTLIELFNTKMIDELSMNLTSYEKEIDDLHKACFEQVTGKKVLMDAVQNYTHPAEILNKFIARVNVLNPLQTNELIFNMVQWMTWNNIHAGCQEACLMRITRKVVSKRSLQLHQVPHTK